MVSVDPAPIQQLLRTQLTACSKITNNSDITSLQGNVGVEKYSEYGFTLGISFLQRRTQRMEH